MELFTNGDIELNGTEAVDVDNEEFYIMMAISLHAIDVISQWQRSLCLHHFF